MRGCWPAGFSGSARWAGSADRDPRIWNYAMGPRLSGAAAGAGLAAGFSLLGGFQRRRDPRMGLAETRNGGGGTWQRRVSDTWGMTGHEWVARKLDGPPISLTVNANKAPEAPAGPRQPRLTLSPGMRRIRRPSGTRARAQQGAVPPDVRHPGVDRGSVAALRKLNPTSFSPT